MPRQPPPDRGVGRASRLASLLRRIGRWLRRPERSPRETVLPIEPAPPGPVLTGAAGAAVAHRGSPLQIVAAAGSGKTEVVAQRVASLIADGVAADSIVAFTFTRKAAAELKARISLRVAERAGDAAVGSLSGAYIGTIHAFALQLLREVNPSFEAYELIEGPKLRAFLDDYANLIGWTSLAPRRRQARQDFIRNCELVANEMLDPGDLTGPFSEMYRRFLEFLDDKRLMTHGSSVGLVVGQLEDPERRRRVQERIRHLIVDEYQDVDPGQERLISLLTGPGTELCVVGDDDQSIYQWRGADVGNIVRFGERYDRVARFDLLENRRSRPEIVEAAADFARSIAGRLDKTMVPVRPSTGAAAVVAWSAATWDDEAAEVAELARRLHRQGYRWRDMAVLVRGNKAMGPIAGALRAAHVPVRMGSASALGYVPIGRLFEDTFGWIGDRDRHGRGRRRDKARDQLVSDWVRVFALGPKQRAGLERALVELDAVIEAESRAADFVGDWYTLLDTVGIRRWDLDDETVEADLGTIAQCSIVLSDFEQVVRRSRRSRTEVGALTGARDRGRELYRSLAWHILGVVRDDYADFERSDAIDVDAVELSTVHGAKGLEWPVVFLPGLTRQRFPGKMTGRSQEWLVDESLFRRDRYEGSIDDERRLFYVAMTRAREWLSLSGHERVKTRASAPSIFLTEVAGADLGPSAVVAMPEPIEPVQPTEEPLELSLSQLAMFERCGLAYWFRQELGFQGQIQRELGYGKAVHHLMRMVTEHIADHGTPPDPAELDQLFDQEFFLPIAGKALHQEMKKKGRALVDRYLSDHADELSRAWRCERPFELQLPGVVVDGRADVIIRLDHPGDRPQYAIVDYKTSAAATSDADLQLQVYAEAGRREGLAVEQAWIHDLDNRGRRTAVDIGDTARADAVDRVLRIATDIGQRRWQARPGEACRRCDVRRFCPAAARGSLRIRR